MLRRGCIWYCAILLWMSGTQHVANKYLFLGTILDYQLVTPSLAVLTAAVLPWLHLTLSATLIAPGVSSRTPLIAATGLGLFFVVVQITVLIRGLPIDCGCFGGMTERPVGMTSIAVAASLALAGLSGTLATPASQVVGDFVRTAQGTGGTASFRHEVVGISIILPAYNEVSTIEQVIARVQDVASCYRWNWELVIVDDGSTDGTRERLDKLTGQQSTRVLFHDTNQGKGAAIRTALAVVNYELTMIQDADLEYDPSEIAALIEARSLMQVDVVYGSRVMGAETGLTEKRANVYAAGVWVLNVFIRVLYGLKVTDEATCYKLFRTADLRRMELECEGFEFCPEVTAKVARLGLSLIEIPISYKPRSSEEGKKIRLRDAFIAIQTLWRFRRWTPRNG
jgi:dolichol-phosphate mannosyltransferase